MRITPKIKRQIEADIALCEGHKEIEGSEQLYSELVARYTVVDPSFTEGIYTGGKIAPYGSEFDYLPELHTIASKLKMYLLMYENENTGNIMLKERIKELIRRGKEIEKEEYHSAENGLALSYISGPQYDLWLSEISIFNERHLKNHPLYDNLQTLVSCNGKKLSEYQKVMSILKAVESDEEFWKRKKQMEEAMTDYSIKPLKEMLEDDIVRCKNYLNNPWNEEEGQKLYVEITAKYDNVIDGFGNGLYQYISKEHFYDPDVKGTALIHNINVLCNRMSSFHAVKFMSQEKGANKSNMGTSKQVFIVHGHDNEAVQEMARTLEKGGFEAVILHEQPDSGLTIIEKIEKYTNVCYAVILYTECDRGRDKRESAENEKYRARQNVVFEHGYLISKLGRNRVSALVKGNIEKPGDINGVVYIEMDASGGWRAKLAKNMQDAGLSVDMNNFCY